MADRLVVMNEGSIRQIGTQRDLYERPADLFVAGFVGRSSFLEGELAAGGVFRTKGGLAIRCQSSSAAAGVATLTLRPERVSIAASAPSGTDENIFPGEVEFVSYLGAQLDVHVRLSASDRIIAQISNREDGLNPAIGDKVFVSWRASAASVFAGRPDGAEA